MATVAALKTAAKVGIGVGAVYLTFDQGVWSNTTEASKSLKRMRSRYLPETNEYIDSIPSQEVVRDKVKETWNGGVQKTFEGLAATPDTVTHYSKRALVSVKNNIAPGHN